MRVAGSDFVILSTTRIGLISWNGGFMSANSINVIPALHTSAYTWGGEGREGQGEGWDRRGRRGKRQGEGWDRKERGGTGRGLVKNF